MELSGELTNVIAIVVRGTHGEDEWASDFIVGSDVDHIGFKTAEELVYRQLVEYINDDYIDKTLPYKLLITGHSRGAAVANLLAVDAANNLSDAVGQEIKKESIYTYTFATPSVTRNADAQNPAKYNNIYNFVNPSDLIPYVPFSMWGYWKYGTTIALPSYGSVVEQVYKNYLSGDIDLYVNNFIAKFNDLTGQNYANYWTGADACQTLIMQLLTLYPDYSSYEIDERDISIIAGAALGGGGSGLNIFNVLTAVVQFWINSKLPNNFAELGEAALDILTGNALKEAKTIVFLAEFLANSIMIGDITQVKTYIEYNHTPESYAAWLLTTDESIKNCTNISGLFVRIACPVDIDVLDINGKLVAQTMNNQVNKSTQGEVNIFVINDEKMIFLPPEGKFTINMHSIDDGIMLYEVIKIDRVTSVALEQKTFTNVALLPGKQFTSIIGGDIAIENVRLFTENDQGLFEVFEDGTEEPAPADVSALIARIAELKEIPKGNYTDDSWTVFQDALSDAQEIVEASNVTQIEVNNALLTLNRAFSDLIEKNQTILATPIQGVISPVAGAVPSMVIHDGDGFIAALTWVGDPITFAYSKTYTATITLQAVEGYIFSSNFDSTEAISEFSVNDIAPVFIDNTGSTLVFSVTFPATDREPDISPLTGEITVEVNSWNIFWNTVTFGLICRDTQTVTITATDSEGEPATIQYYLSSNELTLAQLEALTAEEWTDYSNVFSINPNNKYIIYVKLADSSENVAYINSAGIVLYTESIAITDNISYTRGSNISKTADVMLNGNTIARISDGSRILTLNTDYSISDGTILFTADWLESLVAGSYTLTVYYNPLGVDYPENPLPGSEAEQPTTTILLSVNAPTYTVTVVSAGTGAVGSGSYEEGETVNINAGSPPAGMRFKGWESEPDVAFANANDAETSFTMPVSAVTVTAGFESIPSSVTSVTVNPSDVTIQKGTSYQFSAIVNGDNNPSQEVHWSIDGGGGTTRVSQDGTLTIDVDEAAETITVKAFSAISGYTDVFGIATVTVSEEKQPEPIVDEVLVTPSAITLDKGDSFTFSARVNGTNNPSQSVAWSITDHVSANTEITGSGVLAISQDETAGTINVIATSTVDGSKCGTAVVTVKQPEITYAVTATAGAGGTVAGGGIYDEGATVTLTAMPDSNYTFGGWYEGGVLVSGASATYIFAATADRTLEARFTHNSSEPVTSLKIDSPAMTTIGRNSKVTFSVSLNPGASDEGIVWTVSDPSYATVDAHGTVTTHNKAGIVILIAEEPVSGIRHMVALRIS
jgi:uncharacterized protein YjdB